MTVSRGEFVALLSALSAAGLPVTAEAAQPPWYPLPPRLPIGKGRALVLSGAGARGAYEAGALKWLFRNAAHDGPPFNVICGTSAGAINAAFASEGTPGAIQQTEKLWRAMPSANVVQLEPPFQDLAEAGQIMWEGSRHGFPARIAFLNRAREKVNDAGPPEQLAKYLGVVDEAGITALVKQYPINIDALQSSLLVTATNLTRRSADTFYTFVGPQAAIHEAMFLDRTAPTSRLQGHGSAPPLRPRPPLRHALTQDNLVAAVMASAAIPGVFAPVPVPIAQSTSADLYVDGGVANNTPIGLAADAGANDITMLVTDAPDELPAMPNNLPGVLQASFAIMEQRIFQNDITLTFARNLLTRLHDMRGLNETVQMYIDALQQQNWKPLTLRLIRPRTPLSLTLMGFNDQAGIDTAFDQGYADAQHPWVYSME